MSAATRNPYDLLKKNARKVSHLFMTTNPNRECPLPDGVYVATISRVEPFVSTKANEEPVLAFRAVGNFICDKDGVQDGIFGTGMSMAFYIKESERQSLERAFSNFVWFLQDALFMETDKITVDSLEDDINGLNSSLQMPTGPNDEDHQGPAFLYVAVTTSEANGRKNVNSRNGISPNELMDLGLDIADVLSKFGETPSESEPEQTHVPEPEPEPEPEKPPVATKPVAAPATQAKPAPNRFRRGS